MAGVNLFISVLLAISALAESGRDRILFLGSSTIEKWTTLKQDFKGYDVIGRGVGGTTYQNLADSAARDVDKYKPDQIVLYSGDNDLANGRAPEDVVRDLRGVLTKIRVVAPHTEVFVISVKPSPARSSLLKAAQRTNRLIKAAVAGMADTRYIDIHSAMLTKDQIDPKWYAADQLHMNEAGYKLWASILRTHLRATVAHGVPAPSGD